MFGSELDQGTVTFKRRMAGLKVGRRTRGHKTFVFGLTEINLRTRKLTGKCFLRIFKRHDIPHLPPNHRGYGPERPHQ